MTKHSSILLTAMLLISLVLMGCQSDPVKPAASDKPSVDETTSVATIASVEIPAVDRYPGQKVSLDYKGTVVVEGRLAMVQPDTIRFIALDETGQVIPQRVSGTASIPALSVSGELVQKAPNAFLEVRLSKSANLPTTVSLVLLLDNEIPLSTDVGLSTITPKAFE